MLSFIWNIKTLIIRVKNRHQRMPCNLLPSTKQVVPIALHSSSNTPAFQAALRLWAGSLCAGFGNARHLLEQLQLSDSHLQPFQCSCSFCCGPALQSDVPSALHKAEIKKEKRKRDVNAFTSRCYKPVSDRLFISAGLSWRCLDAFIRLDIHPSNNQPCILKKAGDKHIIL